jgi:uncharacterized membrane protein
MQNPPPDQQGYQYGTPPPASYPTPGGDETRAKTALGLDANLGAALGYPIGLIAIIIFVMEKQNRFARFHALQSIFYHIAAIVVFIVLIIVAVIVGLVLGMISSTLAGIGAVLLWLLIMIVFLAYFVGLIFCAVKAYGGKWFKVPTVGNMTEKIVNK